MRNMIFKTLFASILGSLLVAPFAQADRQGGGTLRAMNASFDSTLTVNLNKLGNFSSEQGRAIKVEWVKYKNASDDKITFEYSWATHFDSGAAEVTLDRVSLQTRHSDLIRALSFSKEQNAWVSTDQSPDNL